MNKFRAPQLLIHIGTLFAYTLLAIVATWPLATRLSTHVPGNGIDDPALAWNLWWIKARLIDQANFDIFHADWMFNPIEINLAFYTLTPLNGLLSVPLQSLFSLISTSNIILLSSFVIGGYGTFLLVRYLLIVEYTVALGRNQNPDTESTEDAQRTQRKARGFLNILAVRAIYSGWWHRERQETSVEFSQPAKSDTHRESHNNPLPPPRPLWLKTLSHINAAAFYAGVIYAFASSKLFYASLGQFNIASSHWIPFCILYILRMKNRASGSPCGREILLAGLFLAFQAWAELTYATFLVIFIGLSFFWQSVGTFWGTGQGRSVRLRSLIVQHIVLGGLFLLGLSPFLWAMVPDLLREGNFFTSGGGFADTYSADVMGYFFPTTLHPLLGDWVTSFAFEKELAQQIFIGYSPMLLIVVGLLYIWRSCGGGWQKGAERRRWRDLAFWLCNLLLFWLLTFGPQIHWGGTATSLPGPFALVNMLPFFNGNRYPSRYSVMVMLAVAILAGYALFWLLQRWSSAWEYSASDDAVSDAKPLSSRSARWRARLVVTLLCGLFFLEHASMPLPLHQSTTPSIYTRLATLPNRGTLLELPTGWRNGARVMGLSDKLLMMQQWDQTVHGLPRLGGNTSRNPIYKFQYFLEAPLIGDLISLMNADLENVAPVVAERLDEMIGRNRAQAPAVLDLLDIAYVTVNVEKSSLALLRFVDEAMPLTLVEEWQGADWEGKKSTIRLYGVDPRPEADEWTINLGGDAGRIHLAEGWSALSDGRIRYAMRAETELLLDIPTAGGLLDLTLADPAQAVELWLNDQMLGAFALADRSGGESISITIPAGLAAEAIDRLRFVWQGRAAALSAFTPGLATDARGWPIGSTGEFLTADGHIVAQSAGKDVGDFAHLFVNGEDVSPNGLGYNVAAIRQDGSILETASFDTLTSAEASAALAAWLRNWPQGTIIAGAVRDAADSDFDGFRNLSDDAINALNEIGVAGDLRRKYRWSHAFVGVVGTAVGSAVEAIDLLQPTAAVVGPAILADRTSGNKIFGSVGQLHFRVNE